MRPTRKNPRRGVGRAVAALVAALVIGPLALIVPHAAYATEPPASILDGGYLISDEDFFNGAAMSAPEVQAFLARAGASCAPQAGGPACLKDFRVDLPAIAADRYCAAVPGGANLRASDVIARVGAACNVSQRVLLVMLQKEQNLVTATPSAWSYRAAMGMNCPDDAPCLEVTAGFVNQMYLGARQQQVYAKNPNDYNYRAGRVNAILWSTNAACGTSPVYIQNQATANLYIYTPYRPNIAALAAGYGTGDECSEYGNRNFYNLYVDWFGAGASMPGAPAEIAACTAPTAAEVAPGGARLSVVVDRTVARSAPTDRCAAASQELRSGQTVDVTGRYGAWSRVGIAGRDAWVLTRHLGAVAPKPTVTPTPTPKPVSFVDVSSVSGSAAFSAFAVEIGWMASSGISTGYPVAGGKLEYRPFAPVARDAMAAFMYRAAGSPAFTVPARSPFVDVSVSHPFYKEIAWMAAQKISTGWDVGGRKQFRPSESITRDAMAAFLYRFAKSPAFAMPGRSPFVDVSLGQPFAKEMAWLASTGVSTGWVVGSRKEFRPYNPITRDAMAAFLYRYNKL